MKRFNRSSLLLLFLVIGLSSFKTPAKEFSGVIIYNISYENSALDAKTLAMMPKTLKLTIKGNMSKTEINMGMGKTIVIFNASEKAGTTLIDMMGQKLAMKMTSESIAKEMNDIPELKVDYLDETKEIAGYVCKKVLVSELKENGEKGQQHEVYYTEELGNGMLNAINPMFKDIDGVLMKYSSSENGMDINFTAISVDKKRISDKEFEMPEGYKEVTEDELKSMFGG